MTKWYNLTELCDGTNLAVVKYLIGSGGRYHYLVRYNSGQVLASPELAECIAAALDICMETDLPLLSVIAAMMNTEAKRKDSETTEYKN